MSSGDSCSTIGIANPSVLPEPVCDLASVSRPDVASWITITWIGKGSWMPRLARVSITASDTPRSLKDVMDDAEDNPCTTSVHRAEQGTRFRASAVGWPVLAEHERTGATDGRSDSALERLRGAARRRQHPMHDGGGLGAPDVVDVRCPSRRGPVRGSPAHDVSDPGDLANDRFVLSKGHAPRSCTRR